MHRSIVATALLSFSLMACAPEAASPEVASNESIPSPTAVPTATSTATLHPTATQPTLTTAPPSTTATIQPPATATPTPTPTGWDAVAVGETIYARVKYFDETNVPNFHRTPTGETDPLINYIRMLRPTSLIRIPVRYQMTPFSTLRITKMNDSFGQIMPDNGLYMPYGNGIQDIFVELDALTPILDYSAFSLFEGTQNADKQVIVIRQYYHPEVLLVEGDQIISWTPAILGAGEQGDVNTPVGDHRLSRFRGSRHMPDYPGVGFSMYFSGLRGYAVHDSYWWQWHELDKGFYGSAGCVNLPNQFFGSAVIEGQKVPLAEFMYRWASTNIDYDERSEEEIMVEWNDPGYKSGESTIRVVIVMDIDHLTYYPEHGSVEWENIIVQYKSFEEGQWFLPEYPWQGGHTPIPVHPSELE